MWWNSCIKLLLCSCTSVSRMPLYHVVKVEMPSVPGGGQKVVWKSVHFLMSIQWSFAGGLFLAVLTECKRKTLDHGVLFLQTGIQQLLYSKCFWTQTNKGCNSEFWFLELVCHLQKHFFILLGNLWFEKCTVALCDEKGHKSFAVFLFGFFFFLFLLEGIRGFGRQYELWLSKSTGMCLPLCL